VDWAFEDFIVGRQVESPARTVTEADVLAFAALTGDAHPLHTDATYAATTEFGGQIAHGLLGLSLAAGQLARIGVIAPWVVALLGVREWRFFAPVALGETVRARGVVQAARGSNSNPDRGIITLAIELVRADDVVAQRGELILLVRRRAGTADDAVGE
jgi:acyl dehydratase